MDKNIKEEKSHSSTHHHSGKSSSSGSKSKHSSHKKVVKKKERGVVPYITTPLVFALISLIVVLPIFLAFTGNAVNLVHKVQETLVIDYNDRETNTDRFDSKSVTYEAGKIGLCEKVGVLTISNVGIKSDVYYGVNRVSMRDGVGISTESVFDGNSSSLSIAGYSTKAFKGLNNVEAGDTISFETTDKVYEYSVISNEVGAVPAEQGSSGVLILSSDVNSKAFSAYSSEKRYVVAEFSSVKAGKGE
ncbi:MAG: sortase [Ruminococcaceae bacterium]|nr:sortase [Oscillospiraceae bacterium]